MRLAMITLLALPVLAQQQNPPAIPFDSDTNFLKLNYQMNLGEVLGLAVNSKGTVVVLNPLRKCDHSASGVRCDRQVRAGDRPWRIRSGIRAFRAIR